MPKKTTADLNRVLSHLDLFKQPLPQFNLKGQDSISTRVGGFCSLFLLGIILLYSTVKFNQLRTLANPIISTYV